ncbi:hypothetical protein [Paenibacillus harenae]|uniref:hypothetical protein n=1 Tax=Paenibacillus harenae TaxID=306543 RepID=UPI0003FA3FBE|nr:hypothetical protein [Paenibacillus harenae]
MRPDHYSLLYRFVTWAGGQPHIDGIALIGPCADDENEEVTEMSFVIVSDKKTKTAEAILHQFPFDAIEQAMKEERGALTSIRIEYGSGIEVDFGIVEESWLTGELEGAAAASAMEGFKVIWEKEEELFQPIAAFIERQKSRFEGG